MHKNMFVYSAVIALMMIILGIFAFVTGTNQQSEMSNIHDDFNEMQQSEFYTGKYSFCHLECLCRMKNMAWWKWWRSLSAAEKRVTRSWMGNSHITIIGSLSQNSVNFLLLSHSASREREWRFWCASFGISLKNVIILRWRPKRRRLGRCPTDENVVRNHS